MVFADNDQTLPAVAAPETGACGERELLLTIAFHPDTTRIGQVAVVPRKRRAQKWILGRCSPDFAAADRAGTPLDDPYISRRALQLDFRGDKLVAQHIEGSSRCRLGSRELFDSEDLDLAQLERGLPLMLSHRVVLMLKLEQRSTPGLNLAVSPQPLIGSSYPMVELRRNIESVAASDLDVLIRGETGSGKELVAAAIHAASPRAGKPMVSVNMAAIPADLAAAALFGAGKGAYTGAEQETPGYFRQAQGGTLFLDEIGDADQAVQPQLLRALQEREIQSVGGGIEKVDVRVVSATDAPIEEPETSFKSALRHRLAAAEIRVPPLREHPQDIGELMLHFLREAAAELKVSERLPGETMEAVQVAAWANAFCLFSGYEWPGNIRELKNLCRQLLLAPGPVVALSEQLFSTLSGGRQWQEMRPAIAYRPKMRDVSEENFDRAMRQFSYEIKRVARHLGVSRTSVYRRIDASSRYRLATELSLEDIEDALAVAEGSLEDAALQLEVSFPSLSIHLRKLRSLAS